MSGKVRPLNRDRLSVLIAMLLLGNVLFRFIELPEHVWELRPLGSPLDIRVTGEWLLIAVMVGLVCTGTNLVMHDYPLFESAGGRPIYIAWILPGLLTGIIAYLLARPTSWPLWIAGLLLSGVAISHAVAAEYAAFSPRNPGYPKARLALNVLAYLLGFALFAVIYHSRMRSLVTATLSLMTAFLLALDLLSVADVPFRRVLLFAAVVALLVGESTWAINYWQVSAWVGGLVLLLIFYSVVNVAHQYLLERLNLEVVAEILIVAAIVLVITFIKGR